MQDFVLLPLLVADSQGGALVAQAHPLPHGASAMWGRGRFLVSAALHWRPLVNSAMRQFRRCEAAGSNSSITLMAAANQKMLAIVGSWSSAG